MPEAIQVSRQGMADYGFRVDRGAKKNRLTVPTLPGSLVQTPITTPVSPPVSSPVSPPSRPVVQTIAAVSAPHQILKVAAYCRVSTLMESQEGSIAAQRRHYRMDIEANPEWELAGIYLEAGVSGTKAEIRPELQRLIADCKAGRVNLILTKSISRFARNTADCLEMVRTLTALGVDIWFEKEGIHTGTMESEFMLSILACLAEDESRSISGNMKWGLRKRFQNSSYKMSNAPYGYRRDGTELVIVPEEAEIVKGIFHAVLSGCGCNSIADDLNSRGVPGPAGKEWVSGTILGIARNPVYIGDMLYQKTFMDEHYRQQKNRGELDQYYDADHHEPIVSREEFDLAGINIRQRGRDCGNYTEAENPEKAAKRQNRYAFTGRVFCAHCSGPLYRVGVGAYPVLRCGAKWKSADACPQPNELEDNIKNAFITCLNKLAYSQTLAPNYRVIDGYIELVTSGAQERNAARLAEIDEALRQNKLEQDTLTAVTMIDYFRSEHREKKLALEKQQQELLKEKLLLTSQGETTCETETLRSFIAHWQITDRTEDFPDDGFRLLVDKAVVAARESVTFHFKCGLSLTESLRRANQ